MPDNVILGNEHIFSDRGTKIESWKLFLHSIFNGNPERHPGWEKCYRIRDNIVESLIADCYGKDWAKHGKKQSATNLLKITRLYRMYRLFRTPNTFFIERILICLNVSKAIIRNM